MGSCLLRIFLFAPPMADSRTTDEAAKCCPRINPNQYSPYAPDTVRSKAVTIATCFLRVITAALPSVASLLKRAMPRSECSEPELVAEKETRAAPSCVRPRPPSARPADAHPRPRAVPPIRPRARLYLRDTRRAPPQRDRRRVVSIPARSGHAVRGLESTPPLPCALRRDACAACLRAARAPARPRRALPRAHGPDDFSESIAAARRRRRTPYWNTRRRVRCPCLPSSFLACAPPARAGPRSL